VTWHDAIAYCEWLSQVTGKPITLPSEAEWEKAARGGPPLPPPACGGTEGGDRTRGGQRAEGERGRVFPWGDTFDATRCNSSALGLGDTTPVGIFLNGASPYNVLDLSGNVWEWTRSLWGRNVSEPEFKYPYNPKDGRENLKAGDDVLRVLRGGAFNYGGNYVRCALRYRDDPVNRLRLIGFRVVLSPL